MSPDCFLYWLLLRQIIWKCLFINVESVTISVYHITLSYRQLIGSQDWCVGALQRVAYTFPKNIRPICFVKKYFSHLRAAADVLEQLVEKMLLPIKAWKWNRVSVENYIWIKFEKSGTILLKLQILIYIPLADSLFKITVL